MYVTHKKKYMCTGFCRRVAKKCLCPMRLFDGAIEIPPGVAASNGPFPIFDAKGIKCTQHAYEMGELLVLIL